jgi:succinate dehydrogenase/fumarate reductase cytochrome b subunit
MTVLIILGVLFIALVIIVPLIERSKFRMSNEQMGKLGSWLLPLVVIMVIIQLVMHYVN